MRHFLFRNIRLLLIGAIMLLSSCNASKYAIGTTPEMKNLSSLLKKMDKKNTPDLQDETLRLYQSITNQLLDDVEMYQTLTGLDKWDRIISAYDQLQKMNEAVQKSKAQSFIDTKSYAATMDVTKQNAAADFYDAGIDRLINANTRSDFLKAYDLLAQSNAYYSGFEDVNRQMNVAWQNAVINIVINPITNQSGYFDYDGPLMQTDLVRQLGSDNSSGVPASFYSDNDARNARIDVDWTMDVIWTRLIISPVRTEEYQQERTRRIEVGKDSLGNKIYQDVKAIVFIRYQYFDADGEISSRILDANTRRSISQYRYRASDLYGQYYATFRGDKNALTADDVIMINNQEPLPQRRKVAMSLYLKMYPSIRDDVFRLIDAELR